MNVRTLRIAKSAAHGPFPPLPEAVHCSIVDGHVRVYPPDSPALASEPYAHFRLLSTDHVRAIAVNLFDGGHAGNDVAAAGFGLANRDVLPFEVADLVVHRGAGIPFTPIAKDDGDIGTLAQKCHRQIDPA